MWEKIKLQMQQRNNSSIIDKSSILFFKHLPNIHKKKMWWNKCEAIQMGDYIYFFNTILYHRYLMFWPFLYLWDSNKPLIAKSAVKQISVAYHSSKKMSDPRLHDEPGLDLFPMISSSFFSFSFFSSFCLIISGANILVDLISLDLSPLTFKGLNPCDFSILNSSSSNLSRFSSLIFDGQLR